jgi:hypothetical protein
MINSKHIGDRSPQPSVDTVQELEDTENKLIDDLMTEHGVSSHTDFGDNYDDMHGHLKGFLDGTLEVNGEPQHWATFGDDTFADFANVYLDKRWGLLKGVSHGALVPGGAGTDLDTPARRQATSPLAPDEPDEPANAEEEAAPPMQHPLTDVTTGGSSPVNPNKALITPIEPDPKAVTEYLERVKNYPPDATDTKTQKEEPGGDK